MPGLNYGFPVGIDRVTRLKMLERKRVGVGVGLADRTLGRLVEPREVECLTGNRNLILAPAVAQYEIVDARAYLFHVADVPSLVRGVTAGALSSVISRMDVDDVLTMERKTIQYEVLRLAQEALDSYGAGVRITAVSLEGLAPPQEVIEAFQDVTRAREDQERLLDEAEGYANRLIPRARGEAERTRLEAEGYAQEVVEKARGDATRFKRVVEQLAEGRDLTLKRLILETMERVLPRIRKIVLAEDAAEALDLGLMETDG
jgi:membrane protease subunit HflK